MLSTVKPWNKDYELNDWWRTVERQDYLKSLKKKLDQFDIESFGIEAPDVVVDIGGGMYGGALHFFKKGNIRVVIDPLAGDFFDIEDITFIQGYSNNIPINDEFVDVLFCLECLDHCSSVESFFQSIKEIKRVVKTGGLIFFQMPMRDKPIDHHPIWSGNVTTEKIIEAFGNVVFKNFVRGTSPNDIYLVVKK